MSDRIGYMNKVGRSMALMAGVAFVGLMVTGCDLSRNHLKMDRAANMEFQDFRDGLAPRLPLETEEMAVTETDEGIPALQSYVAGPSENMRPMPLVSISVNQTVPLRDVLFELAEQAEYDIELDPRISGSIIFTARERPFDVVIARIAEIAGLRYKFNDGSLRVELDTPYHQTYKIDYLSYVRTNSGSIRNDVSVVSGSGTDTGSQFQAASTSEADFWGELETNIGQILGVGPTSGNLRTLNDPRITAVAQNPAPVQPVVTRNEDGEEVVQVQAPQATLQVSSLPTDADPSGTQSSQSGGQGGGQGPSYAVNKQAGVISIYATERQHTQIKEYMDILRRSVTSQVLIEAKILEVNLTDEFAAGIDWSLIDQLGGELTLSFNGGGAVGARPALPDGSQTDLAIGYTGNDVTALVDAVSRFGTVRALASPRLTVLNNQSAVLNVANNEVYFEIDIDVSQTDSGTQTQVDSEIRNVPEGVLINVQPSINLDMRTVSMAVRPTVTRIARYVEDPAVQFAAGGTGLQSQIPVVNVQELDSVVNMDSGHAIVMGGLMQDRTDSTQAGVPVLSEIPMFGSLFRTQVDNINKTELVIFIKATIIDGTNSTVHQTDKDIYNRFSGDRRPLNL